MALATRKTVVSNVLQKVMVERFVQVDETQYTLTLTEEEAKTLMAISMAVGGCPHKSPRKHVDSIRESLAEAGLDNWAATDALRTNGNRDMIYFEPYPEGQR